jgi:hypothetical protein
MSATFIAEDCFPVLFCDFICSLSVSPDEAQLEQEPAEAEGRKMKEGRKRDDLSLWTKLIHGFKGGGAGGHISPHPPLKTHNNPPPTSGQPPPPCKNPSKSWVFSNIISLKCVFSRENYC